VGNNGFEKTENAVGPAEAYDFSACFSVRIIRVFNGRCQFPVIK
jgi:hypothetical protein